MTQGLIVATVVSRSAIEQSQSPIQIALFKADGTPYPIPTNSQMPVQAAVSALTSATITGGESPTEAEHNALRADVSAIWTAHNALLTKLKNAGLMASS